MKHKAKFISGIYNYCDRWCERCNFTARCRNFESTGMLSSEQLDMNNEAFWKSISNNFKKATKLLHKAARKHGIDLKKIPEEDLKVIDAREKNSREKAKEHQLTRITMEYVKCTKSLLENKLLWKEKGEELVQSVEMGIRSEKQTLQEAVTMKDCLEVIQWYQFFIHVKFQRALHGLVEDDGWEKQSGFQRDCDGSAKIALIGTQLSLEAWLNVKELFPGNEDEIISLLGLLQQIMRVGNETFP